jgi:2-amino-4-hydroxy-6-hydroxymethyldihydropteridine diphosphokinase
MYMGDVIILLGSNIDPAVNIRRGALALARELPVIRSSSVWLTPAIGTDGPDFYNAAVICDTSLNSDDLKFRLLRPIEKQLGRVRTSNKYAPRTLDLDAILLDGTVLEPRIWDTAFILLPVAELVPDLTHPVTGLSLAVLAEKLAPESGARRLVDFSLFE